MKSHPVMVLTDSSAYLPSDLVDRYPIRVLPLILNWNGATYRDGIDIRADEFYRRLSSTSTLPQTCQPSAQEIKSNVHTLLNEGYDVLIMPISSGISGTYQAAVSALRDAPVGRVAVLDTRLVCMALGLQVMAAARAAAVGADLSACAQIAQQAYGNIGAYGVVDTLKYLAAGGRINTAARLVGAAINLKPILQFRNGKVELVSSAISSRKAVARVLDLVEKDMGERTPVRISVFHALAKEPAEALMALAQERFSPVETILAEFSPVVGAHVGPGTLAIAYHTGAEEESRTYLSSGPRIQQSDYQAQVPEILEPVYA